VISDAHFFNPQYYAHVVHNGHPPETPSRLSTEIAVGDRKANPFHALIHLARGKVISAEALMCCGDITTCADPTAMNLGWLQLHRLAEALAVGEPIVTVGNHDLDSRFKTTTTAPQRILRLLDPPFPTAQSREAASYWANGYCIVDRTPEVRFVLVNTCSLHGYSTENDRHLDHGFVPEELFTQLPEELGKRSPRPISILVCHHHPVEIDLPPEDRSVIKNGGELIDLLTSLGPPGWLIVHGHRHLPSLKYASPQDHSPVIFSAGSLSANLHLNIQGRAANQFYILDIEASPTALRGRYEAWTWDQHEGDWHKGQDTRALPATGGFGYRPDPIDAARIVAPLVPARSSGTTTWRTVEEQRTDFMYLMPQHRRAILEHLAGTHQIDWESESNRTDGDARLLRLGRR
jgi:hypothetical protein